MGPNRCDVFFKDGSWFELTHREFERIDELMDHYIGIPGSPSPGVGQDRWIATVGASGARTRFLLSQVQSMQECTLETRETQRTVQGMYKQECPEWEDE